MVIVGALIGALVGGGFAWVLQHPRREPPPCSSTAPPSNVRRVDFGLDLDGFDQGA